MKTGDIIFNTHAGDRNPDKVIMVISHDFRWINCLSRTGRTLQFDSLQQEYQPFLEIVGHADLNKLFEEATT